MSALGDAVWALLGVTALALWARSRRGASEVAPPAQVVRRLATGPVLRLALVAGVMFAGWHLFAR
jgi:hypothetical protein